MNQGFGGFNQGFGFGRGVQNSATTTAASPWQNQQQNTFGFGQAPSAFGTPSQTPFGGFGQTQQAQVTPQAGPSNAFGAKSTPFASNFSVGSGFGSSSFNTPQSGFGVAGPSNAAAQITSTSSTQSINPQLTGTREPKFEPYKDREPTGVIQVFQNMTAMEPFRPWSSEELRLYDYELNRRPGVEQPLVSQPSQSLPSAINVSSQPFQFPQPTFQQQQQQQQQQQPQVAQQPFMQQPFQSPYALGSTPFVSQPTTPFAQQFAQQPAQQPTQFAFQQNLQPQTPATLGGTLNPYNYQYTGNLYYRLHGSNNPPPLVFETKLKTDKGKGKDFTLQPLQSQQQQQQQQLGIIGPSSTIVGLPPVSVAVANISSANQIPKSTTQVPKVSFSTPSLFQSINTTTQASISVPQTPIVTKPTIAATIKPAIKTSPTVLSGIRPSITSDKPKDKDSDDEEIFPEKKTRTTPLRPEELKTPTEADFPRRKRREPIYHSGILSPDDVKEPTWGYDKSYRKVVPKIPNFDSSGKDLLEQLKIRDKPITTSKSLINTSTTEANRKKVPGSDVPPESDVEARLVYELLLKPRRDGPYAYRGEYDGTWSPLYGDGREEEPKWEPLKWKQQMYYKEYVKDVKRTKYPITEWRYEAPSWWDKHPYKPVPKELTKDMDQYDLSHEAFVEDLVVKLGLRPDPPKEQIDALSRPVTVKIVRVQKKPAEWKETKLVSEFCNCCGTLVQKSREEKMFFDKLYNPLIGGFESQPVLPTQPLVFVYAALPGEFEDRIPSYAELLNKYKAGIPKRNMYILDEPPRMPRVDFSNIIKGEIEFAKIVKEDVHKICHQDKKCDCPYAKKEPEVKQAQAIPRSHFYCYERLGKKPRENKPTTFQRVHGYQPFSKQKTPDTEENKPTKKHRILVPPQDYEF